MNGQDRLPPPPAFIRVGQAEVSLAKITKIRVHHFPSDAYVGDGTYFKEGWIKIFILNREETLILFNREGYDLLQLLLGVYGIEDPSAERQDGFIYP